VGVDQVGDPVGEDPCLPRSGASQNQQGTGRSFGGTALFRIQICEAVQELFVDSLEKIF